MNKLMEANDVAGPAPRQAPPLIDRLRLSFPNRALQNNHALAEALMHRRHIVSPRDFLQYLNLAKLANCLPAPQ